MKARRKWELSSELFAIEDTVIDLNKFIIVVPFLSVG